jgi:hypothetical protein
MNDMKKILLLFAAFIMSASLMAQTQVTSNGVVTLAATNLATATSYTYRIMNADVPYYIGWQVDVDSVAGTAAGLGAVFTLNGSYDGDDYFTLSTLTYNGIEGTSSDTTAHSSGTTASYYRYLKATWTVTDTIQCGHTIRLVPIAK